MEMTLHAETQPSTVVTRDSLDTAVALLRDRAKNHTPVDWHLPEQILKRVLAGYGPQQIMQQVGLTQVELFTLVKAIGDRYRTRGAEVPTGQGGVLFPLELDADAISDLPARKRTKVLDEVARIRAAAPLPLEWTYTSLKVPAGSRNSVAAIRSALGADADLQAESVKFCMSYDPPQFRLLTFPLMAAAWKLAQTGQLARLALSEDLTGQAAASIVHAFDALESMRQDTVAAIRELVETIPDDLETMAVRARPLAEGPVQRLEHSLQVAEGSSRRDASRMVALDRFRNEIGTGPLPEHVGELNAGHLTRIARALGVHIGLAKEKDLRDAFERMQDMGFTRDSSFLRGLWAAAHATGRDEDFWKALDALNDGNPDWAAHLQ